MNKLFSILGGRKLIGFVLLLGAAILIELKKEAGISWPLVSLMSALFATYVAGNVVTKTVSSKDNVISAPPQNQEEVDELKNHIANVQQTVEGMQNNVKNVQKTMAAVVQSQLGG